MNFKADINVLSLFTIWDGLVFFLILFLTVASVVVGHLKRDKTSSKLLDYMVMGRRLSLPLFVATLTASWYGGIFGVNEITFNYGIYNFLTQGVFWYAAYIIFALFMVDKIKKYQIILTLTSFSIVSLCYNISIQTN